MAHVRKSSMHEWVNAHNLTRPGLLIPDTVKRCILKQAAGSQVHALVATRVSSFLGLS